MSETRTTEADVRRLAEDVLNLARELRLVPAGHQWFLNPGSPTYGRLWILNAKTLSGEIYYPYFTNKGVLGKTAKQAHDFLAIVADTLAWVQAIE